MTEAAADAERTAVTGSPPDAATIELLLRFARAAHGSGYPTADLEERLTALAEALGLGGAEISATPTLVELSLGTLPNQRTYALRVRPTAVDLDAIGRLDGLVTEVVDRRLTAEEARSALEEVTAQRLERPWPLLLAAYGLAGASLTPVLGGGWREALSAALVGLVVGAIAIAAARGARMEPVVAPLAALAAAFAASALPELGLRAAPDLVTLAALVTFLPGMTLTIGMRELATEHLQSGVANTASALVQLLGLVFGVGIGRSIAQDWFGPTAEVVPSAGFSAAQLAGAVAAGLAFTLTLRARYRSAVVMCSATVLALSVDALAGEVVGNEAAVFCAALTIGVVGGLFGSRLRRSPLVFIVPGVLMLVPGSAGFNSALQLLTDQTVSGITAAFDTFITAMSIAYGLMVSTIVLPRRAPSGGDA
jgi:uncharacterized membrane protein YjjP (DUF1212 family)